MKQKLYSCSPKPITASVQLDPPLPNQTAIFTISGALKTGAITTGSSGMTCPAEYFSIIGNVQLVNLPATYSFIIQILAASDKTLGCSIGTFTGA
ncbi:hypothetical protein GLOIN_2v1839470 [Rhizophagus clarus]|uniref:Phosphatidylglycerol/phosphatidylinositol transfer protein n=1 Tax=Rhizophagus clarus TaxID=94130 RepID=A0A8H3MG92_9GLOM|nr:hypothetical protein GLOIN_2v1839470 [Rhizophagus clarus]